ncbi:beta-N-acetylhexosaminidase [Lactiplantibacillus paraplantarum]|uniref:beta-N-acetylhexosaminidase n=1 Tax=Lactiplantibacillus paraplantarum TaxID=60520 RepID=UPI0023AA81DA|nr:beta-N-acetylhexosaminidase [Lactiplantibacillus paraplantarum]WEE35976.1 family 20 glycosylhydrolase [Lactiplantibacillus paraplantarum]
MITWRGLTDDQRQAVQAVCAVIASTKNLVVDCQHVPTGIHIQCHGEQATLTYGSTTDLMHGAALLCGQAQKTAQFDVQQQPRFEVMAAMLDVARNGVPTVAMVKQMIRRLASMGYNELWLYLEDLFEIPEEPYFGRGRGCYGQAELHEIALYGDRFGVTVVPAVQTLAHLHNALKWDAHLAVKDTDDTLLVGADATKRFLTHLLRAASAPFTTNKIHVGMDEAYQLGRGRYLDQNGFTDQETLILQQLKLVVSLTQELGLKAYMWSDLWFTFASDKHEMYDPAVHFDPAFKASLPPVGQVYWDYYHEDEQTYRDRFAQHFELSDDVAFAGGIWTWSALAPNQSKMLATIDAGLKAAKASGVQQVVATMWFDDGAEVPFSAAWYGLQAFATYQYHDEVTLAIIDAEYETMQGEAATFYQLLDHFDNFTGNINVDADNVSKIILYEDLMLQRYRQNLSAVDIEGPYQELIAALSHAQVREDNQLMMIFYRQLAQTILVKQRTLKAIAVLSKDGADEAQAEAALIAVTNCKTALEQLLGDFRALWQQQRRGNGFEIIDVRLGGQIARCNTVTWRINEWLAGRDDLAELREPILPMDKRNNGLVGHGLYKEIVSACELSF